MLSRWDGGDVEDRDLRLPDEFDLAAKNTVREYAEERTPDEWSVFVSTKVCWTVRNSHETVILEKTATGWTGMRGKRTVVPSEEDLQTAIDRVVDYSANNPPE